ALALVHHVDLAGGERDLRDAQPADLHAGEAVLAGEDLVEAVARAAAGVGGGDDLVAGAVGPAHVVGDGGVRLVGFVDVLLEAGDVARPASAPDVVRADGHGLGEARGEVVLEHQVRVEDVRHPVHAGDALDVLAPGAGSDDVDGLVGRGGDVGARGEAEGVVLAGAGGGPAEAEDAIVVVAGVGG